jgi:hypothetical protein
VTPTLTLDEPLLRVRDVFVKVPAQVVESRNSQQEEGTVVEVDAGVRPMGIGAGSKTQESAKEAKGRATAATFTTATARVAVEGLLAARKVLVIDDFHYIPPEVQSEIIRALKPAVFQGLQVVLVLIPHRMHEAARAEMDVDGRTVTISIPDWQPVELFSIAESGFQSLQVSFAPSTVDTLVQESFRSPHLMQDFCSSVCVQSGIREAHRGNGPLPVVRIPEPHDEFFRAFAEGISPEAFRALRRGPERTNRKDRELNAGGTCDTYEAVLLALHELEGQTPVDWSRLRRALQQLLREIPQQHEVTRALEKMDEIAKKREGEPVIDYHDGELHIVDPFFRYFLKWDTSIRDEASKQAPGRAGSD